MISHVIKSVLHQCFHTICLKLSVYFNINSSASPKVSYPVVITQSPVCKPSVISYCWDFGVRQTKVHELLLSLMHLLYKSTVRRWPDRSCRVGYDKRCSGSQFYLYTETLYLADSYIIGHFSGKYQIYIKHTVFYFRELLSLFSADISFPDN